MGEVPYGAVRMSEAAAERIAELKRERDEARQRAERAERLAEKRMTVLRQYVAHHSSCQECYGVWRAIAHAEADEIWAALAADPQPAEAGGEE